MDAFGSKPSPGKDQSVTATLRSDDTDIRERRAILVVEDNKADVFLLREAIEAAKISADLHIVNDGDKAIEFIDRADIDESVPRPAIILLDLNLPRKSGLEVLQHVRRSRKCADVLVVIVTSSDSESDRLETARLGASGYFRKPSSYEAFIRIGEIVRNMLEGPAAHA